MKNLFNGFSSEPCEITELPKSRAKVLVSDGVTVCSVEEPTNVFPVDLTADAFSIKSLSAAGVPIKETGLGLIPQEIDEKDASAMRFGYDIRSRYLREQAAAKEKSVQTNVEPIKFTEEK